MKKNQVDSILINQTKRRNTVFACVCLIVAIFIISCSFFVLYKQKNREYSVSYVQDGKIDYNVFLKKNNFFKDDYLVNDKQYISSLVDYIDAKFNYEMSLDDYNVEYSYSYDIVADVKVIEEATGKSLYNLSDVLAKQEKVISNSSNVDINEIVRINYNHYNDLIKQFITIYNLSGVKSSLSVILKITVNGSCDELEDNNKEIEMMLDIPLATNTISIDVNDNLINDVDNIIQCKTTSNNSFFLVVFGIILLLVNLVLIFYTIRYEIKTRTAENVYEKEMKKILNNYSSYIQTMNNDFDFSEYKLLIIKTFNDMLEIRDTIRQPILMKENSDKTGAYFMIPSNSKILYIYRLDVRDIKKANDNK